MSLNVTGWMLAIAVAAAFRQAPSPACSTASQAVLDAAMADVARGDFTAAAERVRVAYETAGECRPLHLAAWAWRGWAAAAAAADRGGAPDALAPVTRAIETVSSLGGPRSEAAYAAAVLHAAAAAAQDERDEMQLWLEEARALSTRLTLLGTSPAWPLPIDLAEGELWHGVDDYELAEEAFARALAGGDSAVAWRGLARARDRRGNRAGACEAYRRVQRALGGESAPGPLAAEARGYVLLCVP